MIPVLTDKELREADRRTSEEIGIPSLVLMERAAAEVVRVLYEQNADLSETAVFCGTGNNGGDGAAVARMLAERGENVHVYVVGDETHFSDQMRTQVNILQKCSVSVIHLTDVSDFPCHCTLIIDALFGIGIHRPVEGILADVMDRINRAGAPVVSVDMPSGIHTNSGACHGAAVSADLTVTFTAAKAGLYLYPGADYAGHVMIRKIGIPISEEMMDSCRLFLTEEDDLKELPPRDEWGNKGTFGKVLVIAGSEDMVGAAYLSAAACLMSGVGMVRVYTHEKNRNVIAARLPEALITTYDSNWTPTSLQRDLNWADTVLIGPGLGTGELSKKILTAFMHTNHTLPTVFDADALNLLAAHPDLLKELDFPASATPHPGEMSRLSGISIPDIRNNIITVARRAAQEMRRTVVLKDARTVTALPDGRCFLNTSGCSALSTAGTGDVLAGITAAFVCRYGKLDLPVPPEALAVWIHGRCGEKAAEKYSSSSVKASDLLEFLPHYTN